MAFSLPPEVWEKVFGWLQIRDLLNVCLVNRDMKSMVSNPRLWKGVTVKMTTKATGQESQFLENPEDFFCVSRFNKLPLTIYLSFVTGFTFKVFNGKQRLERILTWLCSENSKNYFIDFSFTHLPEVDEALLANAIASVRAVKLWGNYMSTQQVGKILTCLSEVDHFEELQSDISMARVDPEVLATALSKMKSVHLANTLLSTEQLKKLLEYSIRSRMIQELDLSDINFSEVDCDLLADALSTMRSVRMYDTYLTTEHTERILTKAVPIGCLEVIEISYSKKRSTPVDCDIIEEARLKLEKLSIFEM